MIRLLDERFRLNMGIAEMERYAARLGADCAFFITSEAAYATGIGDKLQPIDNRTKHLEGYYLALVKPDVAVPTGKAYAAITPRKPAECCRDIVQRPISEWRGRLVNDFEEPVFKMFPVLAEIKEALYDAGAEFALMSGSGSTMFGIFRNEVKNLDSFFPDCFTKVIEL
jgi:4-diphosphocytidyl-2-C-methyl-D-erythritol kinase